MDNLEIWDGFRSHGVGDAQRVRSAIASLGEEGSLQYPLYWLDLLEYREAGYSISDWEPGYREILGLPSQSRLMSDVMESVTLDEVLHGDHFFQWRVTVLGRTDDDLIDEDLA